MRQPDILILTAHYGSGHIKVSEALEAELRVAGVPEVAVVDFFDMTAPLLNKLVKSVHRETTKKAPELYGLFYRGMDAVKSDSWLNSRLQGFGREKLSEYIETYGPEVIVCTYPTPAGVLSRMKELGEYEGFVATVVTDYRAHSHWVQPNVDIYLVAHPGLRDDLIAAGVRDERIAVCGIPINSRFFEPAVVDAARYGLDPERPVVLVMAVGYTRLNAAAMVETCAALKSGFQVAVVCGHDEDLRAEIGEAHGAAHGAAGVIVLGFVERVDELMSLADIIVTKAGGITATESLAKGLPMIIYKPTPGQEGANAEFLVAAGAAVVAHDPDELEAEIRLLLESEETRIEMRQAAEAVVVVRSARVAVEALLERVEAAKARARD